MGSQNVPYIYEDYVSVEDTADAIYRLYSSSDEEKKELSKKVQSYVSSEFDIDTTVDLWHDSLIKLVEDWKSGERVVNRFDIREI